MLSVATLLEICSIITEIADRRSEARRLAAARDENMKALCVVFGNDADKASELVLSHSDLAIDENASHYDEVRYINNLVQAAIHITEDNAQEVKQCTQP